MKFFQSIRWRLQLWHGLLLALVLAGFGFTAWRLECANQLRRIDEGLEQRISAVAGVLRRSGEDSERPPPKRPPPNRPPQERRPPEDRPSFDDRPSPPPELRLSERDLSLFEGPGRSAFYYLVWLTGGREVSRSASAPSDVPCPKRLAGPRDSRLRNTFRECFHFLPSGECVLAGRDIHDELAGMRGFAWLLLGAGSAVFVLGLAGGWWISTRALRPIADISATAAKISTGDLAQRIPAAANSSELGDLVGVLNDTFARLQASFARQAQFTADASHELRTPVTVILNQTQTALTRERPAAEYRETIEACQRAAQRMRRLTESLLMLARLDAGEGAAQRAPCELDHIVSDAIELLHPLAQGQHVSLTTELTPIRCQGNAEQLTQVVTNLVSNAIHYNRSGGSVQVKLTSEPNAAVLAVIDNGQGIAPEDQPQIFERFYRADKSRANAAGRTGLGLAITQAIVEAHGGTVEVVSELGKGSTFTVRLPI